MTEQNLSQETPQDKADFEAMKEEREPVEVKEEEVAAEPESESVPEEKAEAEEVGEEVQAKEQPARKQTAQERVQKSRQQVAEARRQLEIERKERKEFDILIFLFEKNKLDLPEGVYFVEVKYSEIRPGQLKQERTERRIEQLEHLISHSVFWRRSGFSVRGVLCVNMSPRFKKNEDGKVTTFQRYRQLSLKNDLWDDLKAKKKVGAEMPSNEQTRDWRSDHPLFDQQILTNQVS